ncbi:MAG: hypothetical protein IJ719_16900 [Clostridia bacterium]|nr:hypothetical protein [Clostridia bacterium]
MSELIWNEKIDLSDPEKFIGRYLKCQDRDKAWDVYCILVEKGFTTYYSGRNGEHYVFVTDYLPPATRDSEGFFVEDDALADRIRRELRQEPYCRQDEGIFPLLVDEHQRGDNQDVIGFIPGRRIGHGYREGYMYLPSKILWYSNLEFCIDAVILDFDIYGFDYPVTWQQWREIKGIADQYGIYSSSVVAEIDDWLQGVSDASDPAMTIMCI